MGIYLAANYEKSKIINAMKAMEDELTVNGKKCLTFKPREKEPGHLFFVKDSSG
jgi:hypothetical protein